MNTIKAIETKYKEVVFRSRLEARWAVFFDFLRVDWYYEFEGYELPSGWYVPDFYLPNVLSGGVAFPTYVEVKPQKIDWNSQYDRMLCELSQQTRSRVWKADGVFGSTVYALEWHTNRHGFDEDCFWLTDDGPYLPCIDAAGNFGIEFDGRSTRIKNVCMPGMDLYGHKFDNHDDKGYSANHPRIVRAYKNAMNYRFW